MAAVTRLARHLLPRCSEAQQVLPDALCLGFGAVGCSPVAALALPFCALAGLGFCTLHNVLQVHAAEMAAAVRGTAVSLCAGTLFWGQLLGIWLGARSAPRHGFSAIFAVAALGLWLLGLVFAWQPGQRAQSMNKHPN